VYLHGVVAVLVSWDVIYKRCRELGVSCTFYDTQYYVLDISTGRLLAEANEEYRSLIARGRNARGRYGTGGEFDCDDYARIYQAVALNYGFAVGFATGLMEGEGFRMGHAYNVFPWAVSKDRVELFLLEPQNVVNKLPPLYHMVTKEVDGVLFMRIGVQRFKYTTLYVEW
jgi:hypothetical protein